MPKKTEDVEAKYDVVINCEFGSACLYVSKAWGWDREWRWAAIKLDDQGKKDEDKVQSQFERIPARRSKRPVWGRSVCVGGCVLCLCGLHTWYTHTQVMRISVDIAF
jgi:hypothetical protein